MTRVSAASISASSGAQPRSGVRCFTPEVTKIGPDALCSCRLEEPWKCGWYLNRHAQRKHSRHAELQRALHNGFVRGHTQPHISSIEDCMAVGLHTWNAQKG